MFIRWRNRSAYWRLMRADKPIGMYLLLWPTLWALVLASGGLPDTKILLVFIGGVILMRSAGCVINDYADRDFDVHVERTAQRPLATHEVHYSEALWLFSLLSLTAFGLVLLLDWKTVAMSFVALGLAVSYPFMKRYTHFPQVVLGAAFGWSIPMASVAVAGSVPVWAWLLFTANLCWTVAYDTYYAMVDRDDDLKAGVKSTAVFFGAYDLFAVWTLQAVALVLLVVVFAMNQLNSLAYIGLIPLLYLFINQAAKTKNRNREALFAAFLNNNYVGLAALIAIVLGLL